MEGNGGGRSISKISKVSFDRFLRFHEFFYIESNIVSIISMIYIFMHERFLISWKNNLKKIYDFFQGGSLLKIQEMIFPNHQKPDEHLTNGLFQKELSKQIGWRNIWIKCRLWQLFSLIWVGDFISFKKELW